MADKMKSFYKLLNDYIERKDNLKDEEKEKILRVLAPIAKEYNIDLRKELSRPKRVYSNPVENKVLLKALIYQRYNNCIFNAAEIILPNEKEIKQKDKFNYSRLQNELIDKIMEILIDKIGNYATEDINELYREMLIKSDILTDKKVKQLLKGFTEYDSHIGDYENSIFNFPKVEQTYKIFINTPNDKETYYFLNEYIEKCIVNGINYEMIGYQYNGLDKDHTILYASNEDIDLKIKILNDIAINKTNIIKSFGSPLDFGAKVNDSYYSITNIDVDNYNEYINNICEVSYYRVLSKLVINKITIDNDKNLLNSLINLDNIEITNKNPLEAKYNGNDFTVIKDLINKNLPDIMNTLKIYMEEEDKMDLIIDEFSKSIRYISNIIENESKKEKTNIAIRIKGE